MSELSEKEENEEEMKFDIEMGTHIKLTEEIRLLSLLNSCPKCGSRMDDLEPICNPCKYIEFPKYNKEMF